MLGNCTGSSTSEPFSDIGALPELSALDFPPTKNVSFGTYDETVISWRIWLENVSIYLHQGLRAAILPAAFDSDDIFLNHFGTHELIEARCLRHSKEAVILKFWIPYSFSQ